MVGSSAYERLESSLASTRPCIAANAQTAAASANEQRSVNAETTSAPRQ